jgi:hypothetical protein
VRTGFQSAEGRDDKFKSMGDGRVVGHLNASGMEAAEVEATLEILFGGCATDPSAPGAVVTEAFVSLRGFPFGSSADADSLRAGSPLRAGKPCTPLERFVAALRSE